MTSSWRSAEISEPMSRAAQTRFSPRFSSLTELVNFVLRELLDDTALKMDEADECIIQQRLRDLGYI